MEKVYELADKNEISRIELDYWAGNKLASSFFGELGFRPFQHYLLKERTYRFGEVTWEKIIPVPVKGLYQITLERPYAKRY